MSEASILAIILSLIAVGGTLGGTLLGRLLERNNEKQKWRRDRCIEAYTEVLKSCHIVLLEAEKSYIECECGTWEHANQSKVVNEKIAEMDRTVDKAILIGSWAIYKSLYNLVTYCGEQIATKSCMCPKPSKDEWHKIRVTDYAVVYGEFRNAARNDLRVFPKRYNIASLKEIEEQLLLGFISADEAKRRTKEIKMKMKQYDRDMSE